MAELIDIALTDQALIHPAELLGDLSGVWPTRWGVCASWMPPVVMR